MLSVSSIFFVLTGLIIYFYVPKPTSTVSKASEVFAEETVKSTPISIESFDEAAQKLEAIQALQQGIDRGVNTPWSPWSVAILPVIAWFRIAPAIYLLTLVVFVAVRSIVFGILSVATAIWYWWAPEKPSTEEEKASPSANASTTGPVAGPIEGPSGED